MFSLSQGIIYKPSHGLGWFGSGLMLFSFGWWLHENDN